MTSDDCSVIRPTFARSIIGDAPIQNFCRPCSCNQAILNLLIPGAGDFERWRLARCDPDRMRALRRDSKDNFLPHEDAALRGELDESVGDQWLQEIDIATVAPFQ